jgi:hypothetical protein
MSNLKNRNWTAVKWGLQYLKGTTQSLIMLWSPLRSLSNKSISSYHCWKNQTTDIFIFSNSDFANEIITSSKSTWQFKTYLWIHHDDEQCILNWISKMEPISTLNTMEANKKSPFLKPESQWCGWINLWLSWIEWNYVRNHNTAMEKNQATTWGST